MNMNIDICIKTFFLSLTLLYVVSSTAHYESFDTGDGENPHTWMGDLETKGRCEWGGEKKAKNQ